MLRAVKSKELYLCLLSAILIVLAHPKTNFWLLAWFGLIPLFFALDGKNKRQAFKIGYLFGILFFGTIFYWFYHLTTWFSFIAIAGVISLVLYLSLYPAIFAVSYSHFQKSPVVLKLLVLPSVWIVLEYLRGLIMTGFDWASLGHTQFTNIMAIQIADITGVAGVSFIVCMTNVFLKDLRWLRKNKKDVFLYRSVFYLFFVSVLAYGFIQFKHPVENRDLNVAVVQGNIEQDVKWQENAWPVIMKKYFYLTRKVAVQKPDLIIWPETSFPGIVGEDVRLFSILQDMVREIGVPLLFGTIVKEDETYYNAAILLDKNGDVEQSYYKYHLVPFGEFLPFRKLLPEWAKEFIPIEDFTSGGEFTTFQLDNYKPFSVLICFEDSVARVGRPFAQNGSQLLINMTNDAWFKDSKATHLHLQSSVFRAVENRRSLIRAANTGVSGFIDSFGRVVKTVKDDQGQITDIDGFAIDWVSFRDEQTFYTKYGDVFTFLAFLCILFSLVVWPLRMSKK